MYWYHPLHVLHREAVTRNTHLYTRTHAEIAVEILYTQRVGRLLTDKRRYKNKMNLTYKLTC